MHLGLNKITNKRGLTLPELMISTLILTTIYAGMIMSYMQGIRLNELTQNMSITIAETRNEISIIENTAFDQILGTFNNTTYTINGTNGIGSILVDNSVSNILTITATYCWREKNGRLLGEDANLNGQLDSGEDLNGNGLLDSPVQLTTSVFNIT